MTVHEWAAEQCNRLVNGECHLRKCLVRGGWEPGKPVGYEVATCHALEVTKMIALNEELVSVLQEALNQSNCDGDLCAYNWHERARQILANAKGSS